MERSLEIEKVLASLSAQGSYQSSGEFALDPVKAAKKLQSQSLFAEYWIIGENEEPGVFPTFPVTHGRRLMWVKGIQAEPTGWQTLASTGSSFGTVLSRKRPIPEVVSQAKSLPSLWCNDKNMIGCSAAFQIVKGAPTFLTIVADGIGFDIRLAEQKGHRLVVAGNHLSFDLTGFGVIADSKLKATLEFLQEFLGRWDQETR